MANLSLIKTLSDIEKLKEICSEHNLSQLEICLENLNTVVSEKRKASDTRNKKIKSFLEQLSREGMTVKDLYLSDDELRTSSRRAKRPAKYHYTTPDGIEKFWSGQGRTPITIRKAIEEEGKSLEDFLIQ